jgi:hypothetical protein
MPRHAAFAALCAGLLLAACNQPDPNGPAAAVEKLYAPYLAKDGQSAAGLDAAPLTADLKAVIDKAGTYGNLLDEPVLDFDPITNAQENVISNVKVSKQSGGGDAAIVIAHFQNGDRPDTVAYDMKRVEHAWQIDNIRPGAENLRTLIAENLAPAGDPAQMIAPVQTIYDAYGAAPSNLAPVAPLAKWAPLTSAFATLMQRRQDKIAGGDADPLGFDPIVDGTDWKISDLNLEAASSAVIARFTNGPAAKVIVYTVIQENGAWKIDNIRAPGVWDVRMKLLDAGIQ